MDDQQFILRWHYHETTLMKNLPQLLDSDILTDITLSVGKQSIKAHRLVLATCSTYFLQLFQEMGPLHHPVIVLHNTKLEDMKAVLSFIYRGQCLVSKTQLPNVLSIAKLLKIQGLCDMQIPEQCNDENEANKDNELNKTGIKRETEETRVTNEKHIKDTTLKQQKAEYSTNYNKISSTQEPLKQPHSGSWDSSMPLNMSKNDYNLTYGIPLPKKYSKDVSETCKCFLCGKYLSNQYNLRVHMETHEEAYHACHSCPHVSRSRDALRKHVSYRHPEEYHTRKRKKTENTVST